MRKLMLLAGVAALAVSVPAISMERGGGQGGGRGHAAHAQGKGGDNGRAERARGRQHQARGQARGGERRAERRLDRNERRVERAIQQERRQVREVRRDERRVEHRLERPDIRKARREDGRDWRSFAERRLAARDRFGDDLRRWRNDDGRARALGREGCPAGLARQNRYCMPPGQLRKAQLIGQRLPFSSLAYNVPERYRYRFSDDDRWLYRYDDAGFVYRFDRRSSLVNAVYPLFGNNLLIGEPLPLGYEVYNVPLAYRGYFPDTSDHYYRYDDGAIYRVDSGTNLVEGIVALLTGGVGGLGGLGVGDPLPTGYDAYNVPLDYRDRYVDNDQAWYRYADGAIYQVDPETRLIQEVISLLT